AIWKSTRLRSVLSSTEPSGLNGVTSAVPVPRNEFLFMVSSQLHIVHRVNALAPAQPSRCGQCAERESTAILCGMTEFDEVRLRIECNRVNAGHAACTYRRNVQLVRRNSAFRGMRKDIFLSIDALQKNSSKT